ncbi:MULTISPECIES: UDP-4-amino-4,6-dideoxy-N-acetyl-beta-L-altrosamine transaminase [Chromobacterium]|nr:MULTISPECIES: UDP-4-amino-4,6-dideoxy-N-acetyl-beta-L-altrosamine transaminase [Chromobacterium]MCP1290515.1 UDP-4-amino-4,6-dideoxy-N-acetyl-beta-L-altrosamine transaminase [Chromobacterium sp. S0633]
MSMIPYGRQQLDEDDIEAVVEVLRSDWLTQGPVVPAFEQALALRCQATHAVAVSSATAALHIACVAAGLGPGDWLWTSPNTFVASANCGRYCGAEVDFVDIDIASGNMDMGKLASKLQQSEQLGRLPKVVVPVAFAGRSCDMAALKSLSRRYGFVVIEDASHAIGAEFAGQPVGCGSHADMTVFSFHPVKVITTGEGGAVLCNDSALYERLGELRSHGITRDECRMEGNSDGAWYYQMTGLGFNYRMTDIQAAIGLSQLSKLDGFLIERRMLVRRYAELLAQQPLSLPCLEPIDESAWHLFVVRLSLEHVASSRAQVFERMRADGIGVNVHYIPVHIQPYYRRLGFQSGDFPMAERHYREALTLPLFPGLTERQQNDVVASLKKAIQ